MYVPQVRFKLFIIIKCIVYFCNGFLKKNQKNYTYIIHSQMYMYNSQTIGKGVFFFHLGCLSMMCWRHRLLYCSSQQPHFQGHLPNCFDTSSTIFTTLFCDSRRAESILLSEGAATCRHGAYMFEWVVGRTRDCNHY